MKSHFFLGSALCLIATVAALVAAPAVAQQAVAANVGKPQFENFGVDLSGMDKTAKPGDDFYRYVNGVWDDRTPIPADKSRWGGFDILRDLSDQRTRDVMEGVARDTGATADMRKAGDLYTSFMDEATIESKGAKRLKPDLDRIAAIANADGLAPEFARASRDGIDVPITIGITIDDKDPDNYAVGIVQGGLGLPDRDYYLVQNNPKFAEARTAYKAHVAKMLALAGVPQVDTQAQAIFMLETQIAQAHWSRVESRQAEKTYNPIATKELVTRFPGFAWLPFLSAIELDGQAQVIVSQPSAISAIAGLVKTVPLATWKSYLAYHMISARANVLPKAFVDEDFAFQKVLSGTPELKARWKRGVDFVNGGMGEAVGQLYVAKYFPPEAKAKADALVANLLIAMKGRLEKVSWMAPATRQKALAKLAAFRPKIGYPDKWRDYGGLQVDRGDAYGNALRFTRFDFDYDRSRLGKPADRSEWFMTPQTVNAYANPTWNEIVFPASILQPPFFDPNADDAVNYGAIGAVIGHEISHHFDDQGRKYDAQGKLADWWTPEDIARFKAYTDKVVAQYAAYEPLPGMHVNGELTLGENMADLAGINVAYDAWMISLKGAKPPVIDGFTGEQRFFLGFGQIWRNKQRESALQRQITTDPHTPGNWRPYVVRNMDAWYSTFNVKPGSRFYLAPAQRVKVW